MDKNLIYWTEREKKNIKKRQKQDATINKELAKKLQLSLDETEKQIQAFYARYASEEGITIAEAVKRVNKVDIERYERYAKSVVKNKDFSETANERMRLYNLTMKVNRLEMLKSLIGIELTKTFNEIEAYLEKEFTKGAFEEMKLQASIMGSTIEGNEKFVERTVNASYHNATWSQRIWTEQMALKANLDIILRRALTQGRGPKEFIKDLRKEFDVTKNEAYRLLRTEMARIQTDAALESWEQMGIKRSVWVTENRPCPLCQSLSGTVQDNHDIKYQPPRHPNCRCSLAPYAEREKLDKMLKR